MSNRTSPVGAVVRLYVDLERQVNEGDVIETSTGRGYRVLSVRVQARGKHAGRQHLRCSVLGEDWLHDLMVEPREDRWVHRIRWYRRKRAEPAWSRASSSSSSAECSYYSGTSRRSTGPHR